MKDKGTRPEVEGVWPCDREGEGRRLGRNSPGRVWPGRRGVLEPKAPAERGPRPRMGCHGTSAALGCGLHPYVGGVASA